MFKKDQKNGFIKVISLLLAPLILSGCLSKGQIEVEDDIAPLQSKKVGILKSLSDNEELSRGSHYLETDEKTIVVLESILYDLDLPKYLEKRIEVSGPLFKDEVNGKDLLQVEQIIILGDGLDEKKWETYENIGLEIKIKYKDSLLAIDEENGVKFVSKDEIEDGEGNYKELIEIEKIENNSGLKLSYWLEDEYAIMPFDQINSQIGADKYNSVQVVSKDKNKVDFYVAWSHFIFRLSHKSDGGKSKNETRNRFYEMVHSFEILSEVNEEEKVEDMVEESMNEEETETSDINSTEEKDDMDEVPEEDNAEMEKEEEKDDSSEVIIPDEDTSEGIDLDEEDDSNEDIEIASDLDEKNDSDEELEESDEDKEEVEDSYELVIAFVQSNITSIAPEESEGGKWKTSKFEFVDGNYVYVEYNDGEDNKKVLLKYEVIGLDVKTDLVGYFEEGEDKDWNTVSGSNQAAGKAREVVKVDDSGEVKKETSVMTGYRLLESAPYQFKIQYPANWYYSGSAGHYSFSDKPSGEGEELIGLDIRPEDISSAKGTRSEINGKTAVTSSSDGKVFIFLEKSGGKMYEISGLSQQKDIINKMAGSLED